jgi:ectoine hydroxylase-related dioxygenase (phytanoyl-CoA dioxygenase family)
MSTATIVLNQEQIDFFHHHGYLSLSAITTSEEIARLRVIYDRLFAVRAGREDGNQFDLAGADEEDEEAVLPQILDPVRYAPELAETIYRANALSIARQLLGPECNYTGEHAILKPPRMGAETPWHQDEAYWPPEDDYNTLSIWLPLQEANLDNGCMTFLPGSHRNEVLPHHSIHNDPRVHGLEIERASLDLARAVPCPIPAGGVTIHHCRTAHYAGANHTDQPRRAYILLFGVPAKKRTAPRVFPWQQNKREKRMERANKGNMGAKSNG